MIETEKNHPDFGFVKHHTSQYRNGFLNGYNDAVAVTIMEHMVMGAKNERLILFQ